MTTQSYYHLWFFVQVKKEDLITILKFYCLQIFFKNWQIYRNNSPHYLWVNPHIIMNDSVSEATYTCPIYIRETVFEIFR